MTRTLYRRLAGMMQGGGATSWISLLLPLLLSACTLSMEEYIVTEEKKGIEEPYTEVTPFGEFTYQYRKNVTSLNGKPQEYIAMMNDSVIWFMDNLPSKWIPKEGNYIAANCSRIMPTGVNGRVVSVTREAGMIRVEHVQATQEEVFEFMSVSIDFDYDTPNVNDMDSVEALTRGMILQDSIVIDMSLFDRMENAYTRAPTEDKKDTTITWSYTRDWKYFGIDIIYSNTQRRKFHLFDNGLGKKEEWTDTYEEATFDIKAELGYSNGLAYENFETPGDFNDHLEEIQEHLKEMQKLGFSHKETLKMKTKGLCIPIPGTAFSVIIDFDASFNWELRGFVHGKIHYLSPVVRRGYVIENKKETKIEKQWSAGEELKDIPNMMDSWENPNGTKFVLSDVYFGGSFDVNGRVRAGVGFILGKAYAGAGLVVGLEGKAGFKGECSFDYVGTGVDEYTIIDKEKLWIEPYIQLNAYIEGVAVVAGEKIDLGGTSFTLLGTDWKTNLNAAVNSRRCSKSYRGVNRKDENGDKIFGAEIKANIEFKKLESFLFFPAKGGIAENEKKKKKACIRIYPNGLNSMKYATIEYDSSEPIQAGKSYEFVANTLDLGLPDAEEYHIVPGIMDRASKVVTEFRNNVMVLTKAEPRILDTKIVQWYGEPLSEETFELYKEKNPMLKFFKHTDFVEYAFTVVVNIKNASLIDKWGLNFKVHDEGNRTKEFLNKDVDVIVGRGNTKVGKYSVVSSFIMNKIPKNSNECPTIVVQPYFDAIEGSEIVRMGGSISKPYPLNYPYERKNGVYTIGKTEYVNID